jgi:hypothetical protein
MQTRWRQKMIDEAGFQALVDELTAQEAWNVVPPEQPYGSLDALLEAEIGCSEAQARQRFIAESTSQGERTDFDNLSKSKQADRAKHNGIGIVSQRKLDYLAGHAPALLAQVQAGELSMHKAYLLAKEQPADIPLRTLHRVWRKVAPADRLRFLVDAMMAAMPDEEPTS